MTLIINNHDVEQVLTMEDTLEALEQSYLQLAVREAVCRPRIDIRIPTSDPAKNYQWGTMEGGSTAGYFAIRIKSDIIYETEYNGVVTQEKYCVRPGPPTPTGRPAIDIDTSRPPTLDAAIKRSPGISSHATQAPAIAIGRSGRTGTGAPSVAMRRNLAIDNPSGRSRQGHSARVRKKIPSITFR
jgi:hypothetical protein